MICVREVSPSQGQTQSQNRNQPAWPLRSHHHHSTWQLVSQHRLPHHITKSRRRNSIYSLLLHPHRNLWDTHRYGLYRRQRYRDKGERGIMLYNLLPSATRLYKGNHAMQAQSSPFFLEVIGLDNSLNLVVQLAQCIFGSSTVLEVTQTCLQSIH